LVRWQLVKRPKTGARRWSRQDIEAEMKLLLVAMSFILEIRRHEHELHVARAELMCTQACGWGRGSACRGGAVG
jgi:hypothetical protein